MAGGNPLHDASLYHFVGNLPTRPLADGTSRLAGGLTGQGHHLADLLWGDPGRCPGTGDIMQALFNAQVLQAGRWQTDPPLAPPAHRVEIHPQLAGNLGVIQALGCQENDSRPPSKSLGTGTVRL